MSRTQLSIDTSGRSGSLAIMRDQILLKSFPLPAGKRTAATLALRLQEALGWCESEHPSIDFLSVAYGPGSFTGLRIGVTTAKVFCYATALPLVAVDSVAALAASVMTADQTINAVLVGVSAYRGQVFTGCYERQALLPSIPPEFIPGTAGSESAVAQAWLAQMSSTRVVDPNEWIDVCSAVSATVAVAVAGDRALFPTEMQARFQPRTCEDAIGVGILGHYAARLQQWVDPLRLSPRYLKSSAAEELASDRERLRRAAEHRSSQD